MRLHDWISPNTFVNSTEFKFLKQFVDIKSIFLDAIVLIIFSYSGVFVLDFVEEKINLHLEYTVEIIDL